MCVVFVVESAGFAGLDKDLELAQAFEVTSHILESNGMIIAVPNGFRAK